MIWDWDILVNTDAHTNSFWPDVLLAQPAEEPMGSDSQLAFGENWGMSVLMNGEWNVAY